MAIELTLLGTGTPTRLTHIFDGQIVFGEDLLTVPILKRDATPIRERCCSYSVGREQTLRSSGNRMVNSCRNSAELVRGLPEHRPTSTIHASVQAAPCPTRLPNPDRRARWRFRDLMPVVR